MDKRQIFVSCLEYKICTDENLKKSIKINEAYINSIDGLIAGMNINKRSTNINFLVELHQLYLKSNTPLLSNSILLSIYNKWVINPIILDCIHFVDRKIKNNALKKSELFWSLLIRNIHVISSTDYNQLKLKLSLIALISNLFITEINLLDYTLLFRSILFEDNLKKSYYGSKKNMASKDKAIYKFFEKVFPIFNKRNPSPEAYRKFFEEFYTRYNSTIYLEESFPDFLDKLLSKIHVNYILCINFQGYEKLFFIYSCNPNLIDIISENFKAAPIIKPNELFFSLFTSYDLISDILANYYISYLFITNFMFDKLLDYEKVWLTDLLKGKNLIYSSKLPYKLTKKQAHFFNSITTSSKVIYIINGKNYSYNSLNVRFTVTQGLIFTALLLKTGDIEFAARITPYVRDLAHCDFWIDTLCHLHKMKLRSNKNQDVDIVNLLDYINNEVILLGRKIDFKNLKWESIITLSDDWHQQLFLSKTIKSVKLIELPSSKIDNFKLKLNNINYSIVQLKTNKELIVEGASLKHCVRNYDDFCLNGNTFIFSLRITSKKTIERLITIEVNNDVIIQMRGQYNRDCNDIENEIIKKWAEENNLVIKLSNGYVW